MRKRGFGVGGLICFLGIAPLVQAQVHEGVELVHARLIADSETVVAGQPITLGLHLKMASGWHTYWEYSGDAGLPTTLNLELPQGFRATAIQWPLPRRVLEPGDLEVFSYKNEVLLLVRLFPPAELEAKEIVIDGLASWLVCDAFCLPGEAELSLTLRVDDSLAPVNTELYERFLEKLPKPLASREGGPVQVAWERQGSNLLLRVDGSKEWRYEFFPLPPANVVLGHSETLSASGSQGARIKIPLISAPANLDRLAGVLVAEDASGKRRGWRLSGE